MAKLSDLQELDLIRIADRIFSHPNWHKIGPYFQKPGFLITRQSLAAQYPGKGDNFLCEALMQQLAERSVRTAELIDALESSDIGLHAVAEYIRKKEYVRSPKKRAREDKEDSASEEKPKKKQKRVTAKGELNRRQLGKLLESMKRSELVKMYNIACDDPATSGTKEDFIYWIKDYVSTLDDLANALSTVELQSMLDYIEEVEGQYIDLDTEEEAIDWVIYTCTK